MSDRRRGTERLQPDPKWQCSGRSAAAPWQEPPKTPQSLRACASLRVVKRCPSISLYLSLPLSRRAALPSVESSCSFCVVLVSQAFRHGPKISATPADIGSSHHRLASSHTSQSHVQRRTLLGVFFLPHNLMQASAAFVEVTAGPC